MNKNVKIALYVIWAILLLQIIYALVSFISEAVLIDDVIELNTSNPYIKEMKWMAATTACLLVPTIASYAFSLFGKKAVYKIISATLSFLVFVISIIFFAVLRADVLDNNSWSVYMTVAAFFDELLQLAIPCALTGVFYTVGAVLQRRKQSAVTEVENAEEV